MQTDNIKISTTLLKIFLNIQVTDIYGFFLFSNSGKTKGTTFSFRR